MVARGRDSRPIPGRAPKKIRGKHRPIKGQIRSQLAVSIRNPWATPPKNGANRDTMDVKVVRPKWSGGTKIPAAKEDWGNFRTKGKGGKGAKYKGAGDRYDPSLLSASLFAADSIRPRSIRPLSLRPFAADSSRPRSTSARSFRPRYDGRRIAEKRPNGRAATLKPSP